MKWEKHVQIASYQERFVAVEVREREREREWRNGSHSLPSPSNFIPFYHHHHHHQNQIGVIQFSHIDHGRAGSAVQLHQLPKWNRRRLMNGPDSRISHTYQRPSEIWCWSRYQRWKAAWNPSCFRTPCRQMSSTTRIRVGQTMDPSLYLLVHLHPR